MPMVNMHDAKSQLSAMVQSLEDGTQTEYVIARNGRPAAVLVKLDPNAQPALRIGLAKGLFTIPENIDASNAEIEAMFYGNDQ